MRKTCLAFAATRVTSPAGPCCRTMRGPATDPRQGRRPVFSGAHHFHRLPSRSTLPTISFNYARAGGNGEQHRRPHSLANGIASVYGVGNELAMYRAAAKKSRSQAGAGRGLHAKTVAMATDGNGVCAQYRVRPAIVIAALTAVVRVVLLDNVGAAGGHVDPEPDYSHGFFVLPVALCFLWARRHCFPGRPGGFSSQAVKVPPQRASTRGRPRSGGQDPLGGPAAGGHQHCDAVGRARTTTWRPSTVGRSCFGWQGWSGCSAGRACFGGAFPPCSSCGLWSACPSVSNSNSAIRCRRSPPT